MFPLYTVANEAFVMPPLLFPDPVVTTNYVLPCLSADGTHYFYENPLISDGTQERWSWHGCPCCPPMFLKLMGCLQDYIYACGEDRLAVNLLISSEAELTVNGLLVKIEQKNCGIPWNGENTIVVHPEKEGTFVLAIRKPAWAENFCAMYRGQRYETCDEKGYILISENFRDGDTIQISMDLPAVKVEAHPYVNADVGRVALMRGPLLYCLEEVDNPHGVDVTLSKAELSIQEQEVCGPVLVLSGTCADETPFTAIPYYLWNNRGKSKMAVWVNQEGKDTGVVKISETAGEFAAHCAGAKTAADLSGWEGRLYRRYQA